MTKDDPIHEEYSEVAFSTLKLRPGVRLQLQDRQRVSRALVAEFAAAIRDKSIFVSLLAEAGVSERLQAGEQFQVGGFNGLCEFVFTSQVMQVMTDPFYYIQMSYPEVVRIKVVRDVMRFECAISVVAIQEGSGKRIPGEMKDISAAGAMIEAAIPLGERGEKVTIEIKMQYEDKNVELNLPSVIRYTAKDNGSIIRSGLEFSHVPWNDQLVLYYLIYSLLEKQ
jgi:hypothetical protein